MAEFIQVGFTALRDPATGGYLPAVPLFIEKTESAEQGQAALVRDLGKLFAHRMKQDMENGGDTGEAAEFLRQRMGQKMQQYIEGGGLIGDAAVEERRRKAGAAE